METTIHGHGHHWTVKCMTLCGVCERHVDVHNNDCCAWLTKVDGVKDLWYSSTVRLLSTQI